MRDTRSLGIALLAAGAAAAAGFVGTTVAVTTRRTVGPDRAVRRKVPHDATMDTPHGRAIETVQKLGKWWAHGPLAATAAALLWRGGRRRGATAVALASASSALAAQAFNRVGFAVAPPPGHPNPDNPSYPSGHAMQLAALSLTAGWVVSRERLAPAAVAMPLAVALPMASSAGRFWQDRHWASDVLGGWLAGLALASWSMAGYELLDERRLARLERRAARAARTAPVRTVERAMRRTVHRAADARDAVGHGIQTGILGLAQRVMGQFLVPGMDVDEEEGDRPLV